jgi:hypothetical protein
MKLPTRVITPHAESLDLDRLEVMRFLGYQPGKTILTPVIEQVLDRGLALARATFRPAASISYCSVAKVADGQVELAVPGLAWQSAGLARLLKGAQAVSLVALTLGAEAEATIQQLFADQAYAEATVVDAAAGVLVQSLATYVATLVTTEAAAVSCKTTPLFCPGYADWPLTDQPTLVAQTGASLIGLTCTPTCYLIPQKSMVGLIGWVPEGARLPASGCNACSLTTCQYRKVNTHV